MDETSMKIAYTKFLNKLNFNSSLSVAVDSNASIKTILNVHAYLFDEKVECGNGKAILTGRLGVKILYIDTDGISNTITDSQAISENIVDSSIISESLIDISNNTVLANVVSTDGGIKLSCEINVTPIIYFNLPLSNKCDNVGNVVCKKNEIQTVAISSFVNTNFNYTSNYETKNSISKILFHDAYFTPTTASSRDSAIYIEGKLHSKLLFETQENEETIKKELIDTFNIATEIPIENISSGCELDLSFKLDKSKEQISTDIEDDNSIITISNQIKVCGVCFKSVCVELIDDIFSTENELDVIVNEREFMHVNKSSTVNDRIYGEINLTDKETAIDEIVSNLNITPEITNAYIKNGTIHFEGLISSHLNYIDENKACVHKHIELPFVLNSKIESDSVEDLHHHISIEDCKIKVKRGTIIELDYFVNININQYSKERKQIVGNVSIGKPISFGAYDYQIFLAKPGETSWDLCKRIKISPQDLAQTNKNLPLVMQGGEKIIIKR